MSPTSQVLICLKIIALALILAFFYEYLVPSRQFYLKAGSRKRYKVIGPFNSGTNLLQRILANEPFLPFWKHDLRVQKLERIIGNNPHILFVCMYKPLHLWVPSIIKTSYTIRWLNKKRELHQPLLFQSRKYGCISELHSEYYNTYKYLATKYSNVISLEYTRLLDIENLANYILAHISDVPSYMITYSRISAILKKPSKIHGRSMKNSGEAAAKVEKLNALRSCFKEDSEIVAFFEE